MKIAKVCSLMLFITALIGGTALLVGCSAMTAQYEAHDQKIIVESHQTIIKSEGGAAHYLSSSYEQGWSIVPNIPGGVFYVTIGEQTLEVTRLMGKINHGSYFVEATLSSDGTISTLTIPGSYYISDTK